MAIIPLYQDRRTLYTVCVSTFRCAASFQVPFAAPGTTAGRCSKALRSIIPEMFWIITDGRLGLAPDVRPVEPWT
jgi:hypothetical protein